MPFRERFELMKKFTVFITLLFFQLGFYPAFGSNIPPSLVTDLSKKVISINVNFSGSKFHIFGAVKRGISQNASIDQPPFDILIEVIGPPISLDLFKKDRIYGLWINRKIHSFENIPSFYSISGTKSTEKIISKTAKRKSRIGLFQQIPASGNSSIEDSLLKKLKLTEKSKSTYKQESKPIIFLENTLFSTEINLPTDLTEGNYLVRIHLIRFKEVIATQEDIIFVKKVGIEQWVHYLAHKKPAVYGLIAILMALTFGWIASIVFSRKFY